MTNEMLDKINNLLHGDQTLMSSYDEAMALCRLHGVRASELEDRWIETGSSE
jgi:hypothetical protein